MQQKHRSLSAGLCVKVKYFPRNRDAQDTAGDTDEWREGFHLSLYCELNVVTLSRVLGVLKAYFSVRHLLSRTPLSLTSSTEQTVQEGVQPVRSLHAR